MRVKSFVHVTLGITTEVLYALCIMLAAFLICAALYLNK